MAWRRRLCDRHVISCETGNSNGGDGEGEGEEGGVTVSFGLAVTVGSVLLLLNVAVFVATMCQWPRLRIPSKQYRYVPPEHDKYVCR